MRRGCEGRRGTLGGPGGLCTARSPCCGFSSSPIMASYSAWFPVALWSPSARNLCSFSDLLFTCPLQGGCHLSHQHLLPPSLSPQDGPSGAGAQLLPQPQKCVYCFWSPACPLQPTLSFPNLNTLVTAGPFHVKPPSKAPTAHTIKPKCTILRNVSVTALSL